MKLQELVKANKERIIDALMLLILVAAVVLLTFIV
jgi:hypothetical protein